MLNLKLFCIIMFCYFGPGPNFVRLFILPTQLDLLCHPINSTWSLDTIFYPHTKMSGERFLGSSFVCLLLCLFLLSCNGFHRSPYYKLLSSSSSSSSSSININHNNYCKLSKSSSLVVSMAGFGKAKENTSDKNDNAQSPDSPCACGSGKVYKSCCQPYHDTPVDASSPVDIIRGRFSALCNGKGSYLIKTCHPGNKEFVPDDNTLKVGSKKTKRMIWEKEVILNVIIVIFIIII